MIPSSERESVIISPCGQDVRRPADFTNDRNTTLVRPSPSPGPVQTVPSFKVQGSSSEMAAPTPFWTGSTYIIFHTTAQCIYSCTEISIMLAIITRKLVSCILSQQNKGNIFLPNFCYMIYEYMEILNLFPEVEDLLFYCTVYLSMDIKTMFLWPEKSRIIFTCYKA